MIFYRIYQIFIMLPLLFVITLFDSIFTFFLCILGFGRFAGYKPQVLWGRLFSWLSFVNVKVIGREHLEKGRSYLFVANHQGAYDIFACYGWLGHDFRWMMKQSLRNIPFVGMACAALKQIFVDNSSVQGIKRTMRDAEKELNKGMSLVVFPEGSRSRNGKMGRFKKGAFKLAIEFNLPVVPVTIDGSYDVMPRTAIAPRPGVIHLTIHEPIFPGKDGHDLDQLMARSYEEIASSLPEDKR